MKQVKNQSPISQQHGIVLLEGLIAILLIAIALIGLMGLQANMMKETEQSRSRSAAALAVQQRAAELWAAAVPTALIGAISIPELPPGNAVTTAPCGGVAPPPPTQCFTITATWTEPGRPTDTHNVTFVAHVR